MKPRKDLSAREVSDLHDSIIRRLGDTSVPTLPEVAVRVIQLVSNPNTTLKQFVEVVQTDQALTGRLLRTANSAMFAQRQPVTQLQRAMVLLGLDRLKAMALGFHLSQAAAKDSGDFSVRGIWAQSIFRAWTAFRLTEFFNRSLTGEAFIVGLMQDAAIPMMPKLIGQEWATIADPAQLPQKQFQAEYRQLPYTHVDVIESLMKMWKLPPILSRPIAAHHTGPESMNRNDPISLLSAVAYFVGSMHLQQDVEGPKNPSAHTAQRLFGLDAAALQTTLKNAAADFRASKELFSHVLNDDTSVEQILSSASKEVSDSSTQLVDNVMATQGVAAARFEACGLVLEILPNTTSKVTVYIADSSGNRLLSEEVDPKNKSRGDLQRILMLEDAPSDLVDQVVGQIQRLAA